MLSECVVVLYPYHPVLLGTQCVSVFAGAGREKDFYSFNVTMPPMPLTVPIIIRGYKIATLPFSGPVDTWKGPVVVRPLPLKPHNGDNRMQS